MKINTILSIFTPKDVQFLPLIKETAGILVDITALLERLFVVPMDERNEICKQIKAEEVKGDNATAKVFEALNKTFITPFDREDIDTLVDKLDDAIDAVNRTAHKVILYSPARLPELDQQIANIARKAALEVQKAVVELGNMKKTDEALKVHCKEIKRLEEEADVVYEQGIIALFKEETNTIELIKLKEILQELERSVNKINTVGKVLKSILVKYA